MESVKVSGQTDLAIPAELITEDLKDTFERIKLMGTFWNNQTFEETPPEYLEYREGANGEMLEYIKQFYVIRQLNKKYPGWTIEDWKIWYQHEVRTWVMTGDLVVKYYDLIQKQIVVRKIPGVGAAFVHAKQNNPNNPSQPEDMAKSVRTEFIKNAAYWLGIGFDVYSQEIPMAKLKAFEDMIEDWTGADYLRRIAQTISSKKAFNQFYDSIPKTEHAERLKTLLEHVKPEKHQGLWELFVRQNKSSINSWLDNLESMINKMKKPTEGETNVQQ